MCDKRKLILDRILEMHKAQPVGDGYIDIIVKRENYKNFVRDIIANEFKIDTISWWEYIPNLDTPNTYGMGGPASKYYSGWFAELGSDFDDIECEGDSEFIFNSIVYTIENKSINTINGIISFSKCESLTPAFWLNVNDEWKNNVGKA